MITIPKPQFDSPLTDLIIELEGLRNKQVIGTTNTWTFYELKNLFHIVEALSSARIEGNHTTLAAFVDAQLSLDIDDPMREITNVINALQFIDENIDTSEINKAFILELHRLVVDGLIREGDKRPGSYRNEMRVIAGSSHILPQPSDINDLMNELLVFIKQRDNKKNDLLKVAIAHHRFVWIHPFGNGNGRVVRLLTYAMLCKQGFITANASRLFNPTAVFAGNRKQYYEMLELADTDTNNAILAWCEYVLGGIKVEINKSQKLADKIFVRDEILIPTIDWALEKNIVNELESKVLKRAARSQTIKAADIRNLWPDDTSHVVISKFLRKMRAQNFLVPIKENGREYIFKLTGNKLTRGVLYQMEKQQLLPVRVDDLDKTK